jgi:methylglutaconyl-CoA hydratase
MYRHLTTERDGAVEYVTLNRPEVRNALNAELVAELSAWAASAGDAARRREIRAAVVRGAGPAFCAGADAKWMAGTIAYTEDENRRDAHKLVAMFQALDELPVPLIARVHGTALGGGAGLVAVCDIAIAAEDADFGFTEVKLGLVPAVISPFVLGKIGRSAARELFLTGGRFPAARAREIGLVHRVVASSQLDAEVTTTVREILTASPAAVAMAKALIRQVWSEGPEEAAATTAAAIAKARVSADGQEGLRAFLEKRTPNWSR